MDWLVPWLTAASHTHWAALIFLSITAFLIYLRMKQEWPWMASTLPRKAVVGVFFWFVGAPVLLYLHRMVSWWVDGQGMSAMILLVASFVIGYVVLGISPAEEDRDEPMFLSP